MIFQALLDIISCQYADVRLGIISVKHQATVHESRDIDGSGVLGSDCGDTVIKVSG